MMTKVGFAFNLHFCGERLANVTTMFEKKGCGMETPATASLSCENKEISKPSCCADEVLLVQNQDQNPISDIQELTQIQLYAYTATIWVLETFNFENTSIVLDKEYNYTAHAPPLYQLHTAYIFYG